MTSGGADMGGKHRRRPDHDNTNTAVASLLAMAAASGLFLKQDPPQVEVTASEMTSPAFRPVHACSTLICKPDGGRTFTDPPPPPPPPPPTTVAPAPPPPVVAPKVTVVAPPPPPPPPVFAPGEHGTGWESMWAVISEQFPDATLMSGYREHTCGQYHCKGLAIDIAASPARMVEIDAWIYETYGDRVSQLIHGPGPYNILDGAPFDYGVDTLNDHYDHVHWAMVGPV